MTYSTYITSIKLDMENDISNQDNKGETDIRSNPFKDKSYTLFRAEGDITEITDVLHQSFTRIG